MGDHMTRILIVDDIDQNRYLLTTLLRGNGFDTVEAGNGDVALALVTAEPFDLVVSDILMPVMDGYELCRRMKRDEQFRRIPFIFYTATYTEPQDEVFALNLGAERFLLKPMDPTVLVQTVQEVLAARPRVQAEPPPTGDLDYLRMRDVVVTHKLEDKMTQLEMELTEKGRILAALQASEARYSRLFQNMADAFVEVDFAGRIITTNPTFQTMLGYSESELLGLMWRDITPKIWRALEEDILAEQVMPQGSSGPFQKEFRRKDGTVIPVEVRIFLLKDAEGRSESMWAIVRDITDKQHAEQALRESEIRFRGLFEYMPVAVMEANFSPLKQRLEELLAQGVANLRWYLESNPEEISNLVARVRVLGVNSTALKLLGASSVPELVSELAKHFAVESMAILQEQILKIAEGELESDTEISLDDFRGEKKDLQLKWSVVPGHEHDFSRILISFSDLTARKVAEAEQHQLERELNHLRRLDSLGRLAGGVAHDINNVLSAIMMVASLMETQYEDNPDILKNADTLLQAAVRGRDLVKGLRDFSRKDLESATTLDLNDLAKREADLLERTTLKKVEIELDLADSLPLVFGDASAISNALMNLCVNACDAMPNGGRLTFITHSLGEGFVELSVQDTGEGMAPEVLARAMEPFFTTKPAGKGTGLGLSQVYGTMKAHSGTLDIQSRPGEGTRVSLTFPPANINPLEVAPDSPAPQTESRKLRVLLVDDEELVRRTVVNGLEELGHRSQSATSGLEALRRLNAGMEIDLVILDLNMPGMDGIETLSRMRMIRPKLPVLFATGHADDRIPGILKRFSNVRILMKPFALQDIKQVLNVWP